MTKNEFIRRVATDGHLPLSTAAQAVDAAISVAKRALVAGDKIFLRGFGTFEPVDCKERVARNFRTGQQCTIPAHRAAKFLSSRELVTAMNQPSQPSGNGI